MKRNTEEAFWSHVDKSGGPDACWPWVLAVNESGYGTTSMVGRMWLAHRLAYSLHTKEDPGTMCVLHSCDNPPCCNPLHLRLGTHEDNMRDMAVRNRAHASRNQGSKGHFSKLTESDVSSILGKLSDGHTLSQLAVEYDVHYATIRRIRSRQIWRHVGAPSC